jgi:hypothetical protein
MKRRRLPPVPETQLAELIRAHAAAYKAKGRDKHAGGMMQAADIIDGALNQAGTGDPTVARIVMLEARVLKLEGAKSPLPPEMDRRSARGKQTPRETAADLVKAIEMEPARRGKREVPLKRVAASSGAAPAGDGVSTEDAALAPGELLALRAAAQVKAAGRTNDELIAIIGYKATSLRTFLGNLRAVGYMETAGGRHFATDAGAARVAGLGSLPVGSALLKAALEKVSRGEAQILNRAAHGVTEEHAPVVTLAALVGEATGLQATSVHEAHRPRWHIRRLRRARGRSRPDRCHELRVRQTRLTSGARTRSAHRRRGRRDRTGTRRRRRAPEAPMTEQRRRMPPPTRRVAEEPLDRHLVRSFIVRECNTAEEVIDRAPVFSRKYNLAVDRLEEIKDVLEALERVAPGEP